MLCLSRLLGAGLCTSWPTPGQGSVRLQCPPFSVACGSPLSHSIQACSVVSSLQDEQFLIKVDHTAVMSLCSAWETFAHFINTLMLEAQVFPCALEPIL